MWGSMTPLADKGWGMALDVEKADRLICAAVATGLEAAGDMAADFEIDCKRAQLTGMKPGTARADYGGLLRAAR
jgi:hypothetical protein